MTSMRPASAVDPDGANGWRYRPLEAIDPATYRTLVDWYAWPWLRAAGLPDHRLPDVPDTIELSVAEEWDPPDGTLVLRLTSWYTGETAYLDDWDGTADTAREWIEVQALLRGEWVHDERRITHRLTRWDD